MQYLSCLEKNQRESFFDIFLSKNSLTLSNKFRCCS
jgi:hypothetical protein